MKKYKKAITPRELDKWADQRANESHFLEYGNLPPKTKAIKTPHGLTHGVGVDKKIIAPQTSVISKPTKLK
jgi:hypothetical protein